MILQDILTQTPEMPRPYEPDYELWRSVFERFDVNEHTLLVGHSCGGGFLARWLSENKVRTGRVVLVAPWTDPSRAVTTNFFDFSLDSGLPGRTAGLSIIVSDKDYPDVHQTVEQLTAALPETDLIILPGKGHFTRDDLQTDRFPELLQICIGTE